MSDTSTNSPGSNLAQDEAVFRLSLAMSGAISAGAYTAGVLDFLIQAMYEWNVNRPTGSHAVRLVSFAGASAGGITAAIGTVALSYGIDEEVDSSGWRSPKLIEKTASTTYGTLHCVLPKLYDAWVLRPRMVASSGADLLSIEDIQETGEVRSLLNWKALDRIRDEALAGQNDRQGLPPLHLFAEPFHVYLTISNLRGIPYTVGVAPDLYRMLDHGDRMHFSVAGLGSDIVIASRWAGQDQACSLAVRDLVSSGGQDAGWIMLGNAALATAAFPGGLSARTLRAGVRDFSDRVWPTVIATGAPITPSYPNNFPPHPDTEFGFVNVDGGMINNDPFEFSRYTLLTDPTDSNARNERSMALADRAVVMISPFPEGAEFAVDDPLDARILAVVKRLLPTLIQQARFKPSELAAAADASVASRWIIAPRGQTVNGPASSANIACGLLGGFGGFLDQSFREHDFQLGRRNCQKFLMDGLALDPANPITRGSTAKGIPLNANARAPVLPLLGSALPEIESPPWPLMKGEDFELLNQRIAHRAGAVVDTLVRTEVSSLVLTLGLRLLWQWKRADMLATIRGAMFMELISRSQIEDGLQPPRPPETDPLRLLNMSKYARAVIAALADPQFILRTPSGIAASTKLPIEVVRAALELSMAVPEGGIHRVWKSPLLHNGEPTYALFSRRPSPLSTLPLFGSFVRAMTQVSIG